MSAGQNFYEVCQPEYEDDFEAERINPVWITASHKTPGFICPVCGPMGYGEPLRIALPSEDILKEFEGTRHLPLDQWLQERPRWAKLLGIDVTQITPCAYLGPPQGLLNGQPSKDFIYPALGAWVCTRIMNGILDAGFRGATFSKAQFIYRGSGPFQFCDGCDAGYDPIDLDSLPDYWEIIATGMAKMKGFDERLIVRCEVCGRVKDAPERSGILDESSWDGSDIFGFGHHSDLFVTNRVRVVLEEMGATNCVFKPIPSE